MAGITRGIIAISDVVRGDMLDLSFNVTHDLSNFTGKTLYMEVKTGMDEPTVLTFKESDSSLTKTIISGTRFTIRLQKTALEMAAIDLTTYQLSIIMGTDPGYTDKQTIIEGTFQVVDEITEKPTA